METHIVSTGSIISSFDNQSSNQTKENPLNVLPLEISLKIFSKLQPIHLGRCSLVNKQWQALANYESLWKAMGIPANAFGPRQWEKYFGLIVDAPPLPLNIHKILKSQCPFWKKGKRVEDTHLLVLIPGSINGEPLTLKTFGKRVKLKFPELGQNGYRFIWDAAKSKCRGNGKSYWVLMTKFVLPGSIGKRAYPQQVQVEKDGQGNYKVPKALDVVVCAISRYARTNKKTRLFSNKTYARCKDKARGYRLCVGDFAPDGLQVVSSYHYDDVSIGVVGSRKLF